MGIIDFEDWVSLKKEVANFDTNNDSDFGSDHSRIESELVRVLMTRFNREFLDFCKNHAEHDSELKEILRRIEGRPMRAVQREKDEVLPPSADRGIDPNAQD